MKYKTNTCISRPSPNTPQIHHKYATNTKPVSYLDADRGGGDPHTTVPQQSQAAACHAYTDMPCTEHYFFFPATSLLGLPEPPAAIAAPNGTAGTAVTATAAGTAAGLTAFLLMEERASATFFFFFEGG